MKDHTESPYLLAVTLMYGQCMAYPHGRYIGQIWDRMGLAVTLMYGQCTTYPHGSYIGCWIIKLAWGLALTLM